MTDAEKRTFISQVTGVGSNTVATLTGDALERAWNHAKKNAEGQVSTPAPKPQSDSKMMHGGMQKKAEMMGGGMYKGKKHSYAGGGMVKDMKIMRTK